MPGALVLSHHRTGAFLCQRLAVPSFVIGHLAFVMRLYFFRIPYSAFRIPHFAFHFAQPGTWMDACVAPAALGTFVIGGIHTLLWLPRAFQMRISDIAPRRLKKARADRDGNNHGQGTAPENGSHGYQRKQLSASSSASARCNVVHTVA